MKRAYKASVACTYWEASVEFFWVYSTSELESHWLAMALSCFQLYAGRSMQTLNASGKIAAIIISVIGLLGFPCGTLISVFALYLLLSSKGEMIYSPQYKEIIQATPHIRYKTSIIVWIFLFILLGLLGFGFIAAMLGAR
jgi:hypothetical protein